MEKNIVKFLDELRDASDDMYEVFTEGSCFRLYLILKTIFPQAKPYWSEVQGHAITKIDGKYYDIGGELKEEYVKMKDYYRIKKKDIRSYSIMKYKSKGEQRVTKANAYA